MKALNIVGQKFGSLTVLRAIRSTASGTLWQTICDCGNGRAIRTGALTSGHIKACSSCANISQRESRRLFNTPFSKER